MIGWRDRLADWISGGSYAAAVEGRDKWRGRALEAIDEVDQAKREVEAMMRELDRIMRRER